MTGKIIVHNRDGIAEIILNNPAKLNCIGFEMLKALDQAVDSAGENAQIKVLLIKGAGERAFSTGADLNEFQSLSPKGREDWNAFGNTVFDKIEKLSKPTIALINGYAMGGGLELALCCDFRLGTETTIISSPELQHGWLPGWGGMNRLHRLIGEARAKEVVMLNERIPAQQALNYGILTRVLPADREETELEATLKHLSELDSTVFAQTKAELTGSNRSGY